MTPFTAQRRKSFPIHDWASAVQATSNLRVSESGLVDGCAFSDLISALFSLNELVVLELVFSVACLTAEAELMYLPRLLPALYMTQPS